MHLNLRRSLIQSSFLAALVAFAIAGAAVLAQAQTPTVVYDFSGSGNPQNPNAWAIAQGRDGNLYTSADSTVSTGVSALFKMTPTGTLSVVTDLQDSYGATLGTDGNFYSATQLSGTDNIGQILKVTPGGVVTVLHSFTGTTDGSHPVGPPIQATNGIFYGVTSAIGGGNSTAYSVTSAGVLTTIHTFTGSDGQNAYGPLVQGTDGNFYGATITGGSSNDGVIFKMTPAGVVTVLHNFAGTDGSTAYWGLLQASDGNFYGTTNTGGTAGAGVIYRITSTGVYKVLYNFPGPANANLPGSGLIQATDGKLYGTTSFTSGPFHWGSVYSFTTSGTFTNLYSFTGSTDGGQPTTPLFQHTNGLIYGGAYVGGGVGVCGSIEWDGENVDVPGCGAIFSLNIGAKQFASLVSASGRVGSKIGILGQGFSSSSVVKFNGVTATTVARTGTTFLLATVPAGANDGYVTVTTGATTLTSSQKFVVHNSWGSGTALPTAVQWPMTATVGNLIYVVGGYTTTAAVADNQIYNPTTNKWTTGTALPVATAQGATAVVNNILYIFGGSNNGGSTVSNAVYAYNPTTKTWASKTAMPTARCSVTAVVEKGIVYVIGGYNGNRLNTVEAYNPATDTWTTDAPMLTGRSEISAGLIGTTIVASGGFTSGGVTGDTEGYNATTNTWSALTADSVHRNGACAGAIGANLYAVNGNDNSNNAFSVNEAFNLAANKWTTLAASPQSMTDAGPAVYGGQLYCFGGAIFANAFRGTVYNNVQIYQP